MKKTTLVVIYIVISLLFLRLSLKTEFFSLIAPGEVKTNQVFTVKKKVFCWFSTLFFSYQDGACSSKNDATQVVVTSKDSVYSDSAIKSNKRMINHSLYLVNEKSYSFISWVEATELLLGYLREEFLGLLEVYLEEPLAQILSSLIFGGSWRLEENVKSLFKTIGILHIVAASGFHLSLVVSFLSFFERFFSRKLFGVLVLAVGAMYLILAGKAPSLLRAYGYLLFHIFGRYFLQRPVVAQRAFVQSACLLVLCFPDLLSSVGFQLSLAATAGIIFLLKPLHNFILGFTQEQKEEGGVIGYIKQTVVVSLVAQLFVLPLILYYFSEASLFSVVSSSIVSWMIQPIFGLTAITLLPLVLLKNPVVATPLVVMLTLFYQALDWIEPVSSSAVISFSLSLPGLVVIYLLLGIVVFVFTLSTTPTKYHYIKL